MRFHVNTELRTSAGIYHSNILHRNLHFGVSYSYAASDCIEVCVGLFEQKRTVRLYALENLHFVHCSYVRRPEAKSPLGRA